MLLHEPLDFHAQGRGTSIMARCDGREWSYAQGRERSCRLASTLLVLGLRPGERFATIMANSLDALLAMYAASRAGLVCVPLNCRLTPAEWTGLIEDAEARLVIADAVFCAALDAAGARPPIAICSEDPPSGWLGLDALIDDASPEVPLIGGQRDEPVLQLYTSGTTGHPKGAMISHNNIVSVMSSTAFAIGDCVPGQRSLHVLPMFHIAAVTMALRAVSGGETLVILRAARPDVLLQTLVDEEIRWATLVPTVIHMLLREPNIAQLRFPHLSHIIYGAAPIAAPVLVEAMRAFGCGFIQGFGMTELSGVGTILTQADHMRALADRPDLLASAGRAIPGTQLRVVDAEGADLAPGEIGEILVRGPQVVIGYWRRPDATAAAVRDGWLHSGDAGMLDDEGYLFIRDRLTDMIITGGENVYPAEIEAVLHQHPRISEVSVIGVPDEKWGEAVMAVIVPAAGGRPSEAELMDFCRNRLAGYKLPRRYAFADALPRNASGKVLKRELRAAFWSDRQRQIG